MNDPVRRKELELGKKNIIKWMLGDCCQACGTSEGLQFDHVNPLLPAVAKSAIWREPWDLIFKDYPNLQLLCAPCHTLKTLREGGTRAKLSTV